MNKSAKTYGVVSPEILKSYDGLSFLKAIVAGELPNPPISELMGFHLAEVEDGRAVFEGLPDFRHYNRDRNRARRICGNPSRFGARLRDIFDDRQGRHLDDAGTEIQSCAALEQGHRSGSRGRPHRASRTHGRDIGRRPQGPRGQALCARHDDVHDLSGKRLMLSCCCQRRASDASPAAARSAYAARRARRSFGRAA